MFWGLKLEPGSTYEEVLRASFHVSKAVLSHEPQGDTTKQHTRVMVKVEEGEFPICILRHPSMLQVTLDLMFEKGHKIAFYVEGPDTVYLTGYYLDIESLESEEEEPERADDEDMLELGNEEAPPSKKKALSRKRQATFKEALPSSKKVKQSVSKEDSFTLSSRLPRTIDDEEDDEVSDDKLIKLGSDSSPGSDTDEEEDEDDDELEEDVEDEGSTSENQEQDDEEEEEEEAPVANAKPNASPKDVQKKAVATPKSALASKRLSQNGPSSLLSSKKVSFSTKKENLTPTQKPENKEALSKTPRPGKKTTLEGGVTVEEIRIGQGPMAKRGRFLHVNYVGKLAATNQEFDRSDGKKPFRFRLGASEVIRGWDIGLQGMRVGGKRRLHIPAAQAYGKQGKDKIPPNSALVFEVELKAIS